MSRSRQNPFLRHPYLTMLGLTLIGLLGIEAILRIWDPAIVRFAQQYKLPYVYHDKWKIDFAPNASAHLSFPMDGHADFFNFSVKTGSDGFRIPERSLDYQDPRVGQDRIIHAIGDSYTMGYGVPYYSSYPAYLDFMLGGESRVLNFGLNGYGVIGATEKSMKLWDKYPAEEVVFLSYPNDPGDDQVALGFAKKPGWKRSLYDLILAARKNSYLANVPFALRYYRQLSPREDFVSDQASADAEIVVSQPQKGKGGGQSGECEVEDHPSLNQLARYQKFVSDKGARLTVLVYGHPVDRKLFPGAAETMYTGSRCLGIRTYWVEVPIALRLKAEGHNNPLGNFRLAQKVKDLLQSPPDGPDRRSRSARNGSTP